MQSQIPIDIGTCNLHKVHNGYKEAMKALDFNLEKILACFHSFFKLSTARRKELSDIMKISDEEIEFPLRLVSTRRLSDEPAISRILEHYDSLKQYFLETVPKSAAKQVLNLDAVCIYLRLFR